MDERIDETLLDPRQDVERWERMVGSIMAAAAPELDRIAAERTPAMVLAEWTRPVFAFAASLVALASTALLVLGGAGAGDLADTPVVAEAIVPEALAAWLVADLPPTVEELVTLLEGGAQ